jgi:hypothetical protein
MILWKLACDSAFLRPWQTLIINHDGPLSAGHVLRTFISLFVQQMFSQQMLCVRHGTRGCHLLSLSIGPPILKTWKLRHRKESGLLIIGEQ